MHKFHAACRLRMMQILYWQIHRRKNRRCDAMRCDARRMWACTKYCKAEPVQASYSYRAVEAKLKIVGISLEASEARVLEYSRRWGKAISDRNFLTSLPPLPTYYYSFYRQEFKEEPRVCHFLLFLLLFFFLPEDFIYYEYLPNKRQEGIFHICA